MVAAIFPVPEAFGLEDDLGLIFGELLDVCIADNLIQSFLVCSSEFRPPVGERDA